ncbi:outer membrane protein assembly factor BamB family protein [Streptomyces pactum]|uniref:outer membrane protein assembly factor BamB family protein n=1 Tax=Streptomyces pactum TaxID=68249 RepID=UPI0027DDACED|nr:PQQ-binding-like beta-propeller repeat protein [Streptomyces pactum]
MITEPEHTDTGARRRTLLAAGAAVTALAAVIGGVLVYSSSSGGVRTGGPQSVARDVSVPRGWRAWELDLPKAAGDERFDSDLTPGCLAADTALYCGGTGFRTVRVDGLTGKVTWRARGLRLSVGNPDDDTTVGPANTAPFAAEDGLVYVHDSPREEEQRLVALRADSGDVAWSHPVSGMAGSVLVGDLLIGSAPGDREMVAWDARTGAARWTTPMPRDAECSPLPEPTGGVPYVVCLDLRSDGAAAFVLRLDKKDGDAHEVGRPGEIDRPLGVYDGELLFLPMVDSELDRYRKLIRIDPRTGRRSETPLPQNAIGDATLIGHRLFFVQESGRITLVDPADGTEVWSSPTSVERLGPPTVSVESGTVYLGTASGRLLAVDVGSGDELWQTPARSASSGWIEAPGVAVVRGMVTGVTSSGTAFSLDPAHPQRNP